MTICYPPSPNFVVHRHLLTQLLHQRLKNHRRRAAWKILRSQRKKKFAVKLCLLENPQKLHSLFFNKFQQQGCLNKTRTWMTLTVMLIWKGTITWGPNPSERVIGILRMLRTEETVQQREPTNRLCNIKWSVLKSHTIQPT